MKADILLAFGGVRSRVVLSFCLPLLCLHSVDGQATGSLAKLVNGTLPNVAAFQASSAQVTQYDKQGFISSTPQVASTSQGSHTLPE
jgi:hypothetical protein